MKTKLLVLLLLSSIFFYAQDYIPVLEEGAFWDVSYYEQGSLCNINRRRFVLGDEITINDTAYKQLKVYTINGITDGECESAPFVVSTDYYIDDVYVREDINERKVYILSNRNTQDYQEFTLCDFNLEVGDMLVNGYDVGDVEITNIQIENGVKQYSIDGYSYAEGIGGIGGIAAPLLQFEYYDELECFGDIETNENNCSAFAGTDDYLLENVNLFPNPAKTTVQVKTTAPLDITIYTILGKKKYSYTNILNENLNISHLASGLYYVKLKDVNSNAEKTLKLIKE